MKVSSKIFSLDLKHVFGISRNSYSVIKSLIVRLEQDGIIGYGEAVADPYYGFTAEGMQNDLEKLRPFLEAYKLTDPELFWDELNVQLDKNRFLHCAIDIAANDLFGKMKGLPLYKIWGLEPTDLPMTNFTIGIDSIEVMKSKLLEMPWPLYKVKLGTKHDIEIITELRTITDSKFRVDANTGWNVSAAIKNSLKLKDLGVEFIEQPLPADKWEEMEEVYANSMLPLIADEACRTFDDLNKCVGRFHGINVKLVKAGGLTPARRMILAAKELGLRTMVGCMTESSVGIAAVGQLLPYLDYVDMDGALLLKQDIAKAHDINYGKITLSDRPGTGVILNSDF
jgi:L-alanine-DL-glutamate epimerase-like enolase superfamily enzyme